MGFFKKNEASQPAATDAARGDEADRFLAIITNGSAASPLLPDDLYETLPGLLDAKTWVIEALSPLPVVSASASDLSAAGLSAFLRAVEAARLRAVVAKGTVKYGLIGAGSRMSYGSRGALVSALVEAAITLERAGSWSGSEVAHLLGVAPPSSPVRVAGVDFYSLPSTRGAS